MTFQNVHINIPVQGRNNMNDSLWVLLGLIILYVINQHLLKRNIFNIRIVLSPYILILSVLIFKVAFYSLNDLYWDSTKYSLITGITGFCGLLDINMFYKLKNSKKNH